MTTLVLLGSPHLERDGAIVDVDTRKALALLAYLVVSGRRHTRDTLAAFLWPDYGQTQGRAALRRTLSSLNKAAPECLAVDRDSIRLDPQAALVVDLLELQRCIAACRGHGHPSSAVCAACVEPLHKAVTLFADDFMAGFGLRDSPAFDDWQLVQAENLRRELAGVLERLVRWHGEAGEYEAAVVYARRWLALDPLHEAAHRALMQLYAWSGQRSAALQQYHECLRILEQELDVAPLAETTELYTAIKDKQLPPPVVVRTPGAGSGDLNPVAAEPSTTRAARPFRGRAAELALLHQQYAAIKHDGRLLVLEGVAGVGKTRLARKFMERAEAGSAATVILRWYADETNLAFGPVIEAVQTALEQPASSAALAAVPEHALGELARLVPEIRQLRPDLPPPPPLDSPGAQSRFFEGLREALLALCSGRMPGVLLCDDVHWADEASLDLLAYLIRRLHGRPVLLLLTWRSEQVPPQHRLRQIAAEAQRAGRAMLIPLTSLDQQAVQELACAVLPDAPAELAARLFRVTGGLPLFVVEYLAALVDGALPADRTEWALPGGVRDLLRSRLATVSEAGRQILAAAAVIGRSFDFDTLRAASGRSEDETIAALEELFGQGLVAEEGSAGPHAGLRYDFSHEQLRTLVYEETSLTRRRVLHRRVAEALRDHSRVRREGTRSDAAPYSLIAYHYRLAGHDADAARYFQLAAEHARSLYANAEALDHVGAALALGHPDPAALHELKGDLQTLQGEYLAALESYAAAAELRGTSAALEHKRGLVHLRRGAWPLADQGFAAALSLLGDDGDAAERSRILADRSLATQHAGDTAKALVLAQAALDLARRHGDTRALAQAHNIVGMLLSKQGDVESGREHLRRSLQLAETLGDPGVRVAALNNLALLYQGSDATDEAIPLAEQALLACQSLGDRHREAALHNNLADLYHARGDTVAAMRHLKQAVAIFAEIGVESGAIQPAIWKLTEW